jgi:hypothetical protein
MSGAVAVQDNLCFFLARFLNIDCTSSDVTGLDGSRDSCTKYQRRRKRRIRYMNKRNELYAYINYYNL